MSFIFRHPEAGSVKRRFTAPFLFRNKRRFFAFRFKRLFSVRVFRSQDIEIVDNLGYPVLKYE